MRKILLLLLGLLLIGILSYFCFMNKANSIENDLVSTTQNIYATADKPLNGININIEGNELEMTRNLILTGTAATIEQKNEAERIARNVSGVTDVNNQIMVKEKEVVEEKEENYKKKSIASPSPYKVSAIKEKNGKITLLGYIPTDSVHEQLIAEAELLFGKENITDKLQVIAGAPDNWSATTKLGIDKLAVVEHGQFEIIDSSFSFKGYVSDKENKTQLLSNFSSHLSNNYNGTYNIDTPAEKTVLNASKKSLESPKTKEPTPLAKVSKETPIIVGSSASNNANTCQEKFKKLLTTNKIHFAYNKANIKKQSYKLLNQVATVAKGCPENKITIEGHTDSDGKKSYNQRLSMKRATAVKNYLIKRNISKDRLEAIGYGETSPISKNDTKEGKKLNRRIEFNVKGIK